MRGKIILLVGVLLLAAPKVEAAIIVSEILADPAGDLSGDSNSDGVRSGIDDEFIEIFNSSNQIVNISGWYLTDSISTRHVFENNTFLQPYAYLVTYGGGAPNLPDIDWQLASSGSLGLNNSGDSVALFDLNNVLVDQVIYDSIGGQNQSITKTDNGFVLHSSLPEANGTLFSPGTDINGQPFQNAAVPDLPSAVYFLSSLPALIYRIKRK